MSAAEKIVPAAQTAAYLRGVYDGCALVKGLTEAAIREVRLHYDESIFPPRPPGPHSEVYDGEAASVARLTCDNVTREFNVLYENPAARDQGGDPSGERT